MLQHIYDFNAHPRSHLFKVYLTTWTYYDLCPISMRNAAHTSGSNIIDTHGSNLASVLFLLKTSKERAYRRLLEITQKIEPRLDVINFPGSRDTVFMHFDDPNGYSLPVSNVSNGTLRFLAMAYILLMQSSLNIAPLCIIEEPENGIHVGFLKTLFGIVDQSSFQPQVIFTSHSHHILSIFSMNTSMGYLSLTKAKGVRKSGSPMSRRSRRDWNISRLGSSTSGRCFDEDWILRARCGG